MPTEKAHGVQVVKMCEAFCGLGADLELVVPGRSTKVEGDAFNYYGIGKRFEIKKIPCFDSNRQGWGILGFLAQTISFLFSAKIYLFFKKNYVLYTREPLAGLFFKNYVLELHSLPDKIKPMNLKFWKKAKKIIVLTGFIAKKLVEFGIVSDKIMVAPDGVDLKEFSDISKQEAREKIGLPMSKVLVGYAGMLKTMEMEKGVDVAIKSLSFFGADHILVLIGGEKKDVEFYRKLSHDLGLQDKVFFAGKVAHKNVSVYLQACDVLVAPFPENNHYKFYMSPLKLFEYMAAKRPIVISDLPSIREIVDENNAVLVKAGDPKALAEGIKKILRDKIMAVKITEASFKKASFYSWENRAKNILEFIEG